MYTVLNQDFFGVHIKIIHILGIRQQILYKQNFRDNVNDFPCVFKRLTTILTNFQQRTLILALEKSATNIEQTISRQLTLAFG